MQTEEFNKTIEIKKAQKYLNDDKISEKLRRPNVKEDITKLAKKFQRHSVFSYARRLYQLLYNEHDHDKQVIEQLAVCTYKDTDLSSDIKFNAAAELLNRHFNKKGKKNNANALGLLGSIYKKKWQYENYDGHLYQSLEYYVKGYNLAQKELKEKDPQCYTTVFGESTITQAVHLPVELGYTISEFGYCGINTAFVYDLLANLDFVRKGKKLFSSISEKYKSEALRYRKEIIKVYNYKFDNQYQEEWKNEGSTISGFSSLRKYWFFISAAEAYLGRKKFEVAKEYYIEALNYGETPLWMRHSATIQGRQLLDLLCKDDHESMQKGQEALRVLLADQDIPEIRNEKIGLALSGGGFRASLFHIGVLAQLAEAGILHKVEVISCVSGGSILGAYYYLKLKKLLEAPNKRKLDESDYVDLVAELEKEFLDKVNKNVRLNIFSSLFHDNFKIAFKSNYTRTSRTAHLYDDFFYKGLLDGNDDILMKDLRIEPIDPIPEKASTTAEENNTESNQSSSSKKKEFNPSLDNWKREYKVPILILNATTLNTGHSWQFTATWMGESPAYINSEFDALPSLRRMYYGEVPKRKLNILQRLIYRNKKHPDSVRLSRAVAASAGVPGLFSPVAFNGIYKDYEKVLLVDGGVHDNQGISTLYEQECNMLIISDASGQMPEDKKPKDSIPRVVSRTNSILQERIRHIQFKELESRKKSGLIRDYMLMHFTKDLQGEIIDWKECEDPYMPPDAFKHNASKKNTGYEIDKEIQKRLARIRTDLDAFHKSEAYGLMYSGYKMTLEEIKGATSKAFLSKERIKTSRGESPKWNFMKIDSVHKENNLRAQLKQRLKPSSNLVGKLYPLSFTLRFIIWSCVALLIGAYLILEFYLYPEEQLFIKWSPYPTMLICIVVIEQLASYALKIRSVAGSCILFVFLFFLGILFWVLNWFTGWYLRAGDLPGGKKRKGKASSS